MNVRSVVIAAALLLALVPRAARAHGEGVLKVPASSVAAGSPFAVQGSSFEKGMLLRLVLLGALQEYALQEVVADTAGAFSVEVTLPAEARPGQYRVVAIAPDGDQVASLDLVVTPAAAAAGTGDPGAQEEHGTHGEAAGEWARADEMPVERSWSAAEWGLIGLLIGLAGGGGLMLFLRGDA